LEKPSDRKPEQENKAHLVSRFSNTMADPIELNETMNHDINESGSENLKGDEKLVDEDDEMGDLGNEDIRLKGVKIRGVSLSNIR
jgi:hypothetical protein